MAKRQARRSAARKPKPIAQKAGPRPSQALSPKRAAKRSKAAPAAPAPAPAAGPKILHILSDSTGNLAQHTISAVLTQFPQDSFVVHRQNFLQSEGKLAEALEVVRSRPGLVVHAVVSPQAKKLITDRCQEMGVPSHDLTGRFVEFLTRESGIRPQPDVRRLHDVSQEYHQRIKALEFTLEHDDGLRVETIHEADIVLTGVSRTSKTPTSIFLAQQGYRVANVPLTWGTEPPRQLLDLPSKNVVGLVIDPRQLVEIRTTRLHQWHMGSTSYNDEEQVIREVAWSRQLFTRAGWPVLDVTGRAVEETAARVVNLLGLSSPPG